MAASRQTAKMANRKKADSPSILKASESVLRYSKEALADPSWVSLDKASSMPRQQPMLIPRTPRIFIKANCLNDKRGRMPPAAMIRIDRKNRFMCSLSVPRTQITGYIWVQRAPRLSIVYAFFLQV